jgi:hypothetical protein
MEKNIVEIMKLFIKKNCVVEKENYTIYILITFPLPAVLLLMFDAVPL